MRRGYLYASLLLISAATLIFELALTRLFSVIEWYHFAFLSVSVALLGYGASGTLLMLLPGRQNWGRLAPLFPLSLLASYLIVNHVPFDSYQLAWDPRQILYLAIHYLGLVIPFGLAGLLIAHWLAQSPTHSHRIYAANLMGSALGAGSLLYLLPQLGAEGAVMAAAALAAGGACTALSLQPRAKGRWLGTALSLALAVIFAWSAAKPPAWLAPNISPYKSLCQALRSAGARLTFREWTVNARIDVVESPHIHSAPGLSLSFKGPLPPQHGLTIDAGNLSPITRRRSEADEALLSYLPTSIPYRLRPGARALVLLPRGGLDVAVALRHGARQVAVVEDNAAVARVVGSLYREWNGGLYRDARVTLHIQDMRSALRRASSRYTVVLLSLTDSYQPLTAGTYSLTEDYRYTVEAMEAALGALEERGVLVVSRWLQDPPSESLRAAATIVAAMERRGIEDVADHLLAYRSWSTMTILASLTPFSSDDIRTLRELCSGLGYDLVHYPGMAREEANRFNRLPEPVYYQAMAALLKAPDRRAFYRQQPFDITPATDDHPFFGHYFRWRQLPQIIARLGRTWEPFGGSGFLLILALLILATLGATMLIVLPLLVGKRSLMVSRRYRGRILIYFGALGFGFLCIEIPLMQQFILYLGQPALSFIIVLAAVLLFSGMGSLFALNIELRISLALLVIAALLYPSILATLFHHTLHWPIEARGVVVLACLLPLGLLMGTPFAGGLRRMEEIAPGVTPWAWAINGSTSVISSILSAVLALSGGFRLVLMVAAACYAAALIAIWSTSAPPSTAQKSRP
ncbi:MAG: hypothetical protein H5T69_04100 [Chloroflexi bacterium]|nr:hypothetical protein [Chloroflexota bacterium]